MVIYGGIFEKIKYVILSFNLLIVLQVYNTICSKLH